MALKLGELIAYLRTDNKQLIKGLEEGKREAERTGDQMDRDAKDTSASVAASWASKLAAMSGFWRAHGRQASESLQGVRKELRGVGDDADRAGGRGARGFVDRFQSTLGQLPGVVGKVFGSMPPMVSGPVAAAGGAIALTLIAAIGAGLAAGILVLVGGGVLAAGIKAAADSPQVQSAWTRFTDRAKAAFKDFGKPFEGPVSRALGTFGDSIERMAPTLKEMGKSMAPLIDKLAPALGKMAEKALPGIQRAMEASKPLFETLADKAPEIGEAVSRFFDKMAAAAPGANLFLKDLIAALLFMIDQVGSWIMMFAKLYEAVHKAWSKIKSAFVDGVAWILRVMGQIIGGAAAAFGWMPGIGPKLKTAAAKFADFAARANTSLASIRDKEITITVKKHEQMFGRPGTTIGGIGGSGFKGLASGGPFKAGDVTWVGENGPELVKWGGSGMVIPNHVATRTAPVAAGSGGGFGGTLRVILQWPDGRTIREELIDYAGRIGITPAALLPATP